MSRRRSLLVMLALGLVVAGCGTSGSGTLVTEERAAGVFSEVRVGNALELRLTVDPTASPAISVTFDDNLIGMIETRLAGDALIVEASGSYNVSGGGRFIEVTTPTLTTLRADGASDVAATGSTAALDLGVSGASDADLADLIVADLVLDVSGASDATVHATASVQGEASGASDVLILGNPGRVDVDSSGASNVEGR